MTWKSINQELRDKNLVRSRKPPATSLSRTMRQCQPRPAEVLIEADTDWDRIGAEPYWEQIGADPDSERIGADPDSERIEQDAQQAVVL
jgi:hypothetical protein